MMAWKRHILKFALLFCMGLQLAAAAEVTTKEIWPLHQGMHEYSLANGKLLLAVGTFQDTTSFKRIYHFFYVRKGLKEWIEVPVVGNADELDFVPSSSSGGDVTLEDWISVAHGNKFYFVRASKRADKGWNEKGGVKATWFQFIEAPDDAPDGPAYALKPVFSRQYAASPKTNVETVLRKEFGLKPVR